MTIKLNENKRSVYYYIKSYWAYFCIAIFLLFVASFIFINGQSIYIPIHDNLEDMVMRYRLLQNNDLFFERSAEAPILGGIDRNSLPSELKLQTWIYMLLPTFISIVVIWFVKVLLAIFGAVLLGKTILEEAFPKYRTYIALCGFFYGIAPNSVSYAFDFAALPLILAVLIKMYKQPRVVYYIILFFVPSLLNFTYVGMYICGYLLVFFLIEWVVTKKPAWHMLGALITFSIGSILVEWRLFALMLTGKELIRSSMVPDIRSFSGTVKTILYGFIRGHSHSADAHMYVVLPTCFVFFVILNYKYLKAHSIKSCIKDPFNWLMLWAASNSILFGLDSFGPFAHLVDKILPSLKGLSFARTLWFNGFIWYLSFAYVLCKIPYRKLPLVLCLMAFVAICASPDIYNIIRLNVKNEIDKTRNSRELVNYHEFYSEDLFNSIKKSIGYEGEWSVAFGMHPAVIEWNDIATLDGYHPYYSQEYKEKFRELIAPELEVDEKNRKYFDDWGGRAYIFSNECSYEPALTPAVSSANMRIDVDTFRELNGVFVFSIVKVLNAEDLGFVEQGVFRSDDSPYTVYVYKLD